MRTIACFGAAVAMVLAASAAWADEPTTRTSRDTDRHAVSSFRASSLIGVSVRNSVNEDLGKIEDLVVDVNSGKVRYAALSFGGFLGIGDKLFAVPMRALKLHHEGDSSFFVLNVDKQRLENAPGFNQDAWPSFADPSWDEVDAFYGTDTAAARTDQTHTGVVVATDADRLTMTDATSGKQHSHDVGATTEIMVNGQRGNLSDLRPGQQIVVSMAQADGKWVVTRIATASDTAQPR